MTNFWQSYFAGLASGVTLAILGYIITRIIRQKRQVDKSQNVAPTFFTPRILRSILLMSFGLILVVVTLFFPTASWLTVVATMMLIWGAMGLMMN